MNKGAFLANGIDSDGKEVMVFNGGFNSMNETLFSYAKEQGILEESSTKKYKLGTRLVIGERVFRYAQAGAAAIAPGELLQSAVNGGSATLQTGLTIATASAVGDAFGYATVGTDTIAADLFADGWYLVTDGTEAQGRGMMYKIKSHPASAHATTKFTFYDAIPRLISTSAKATLIANLYKGVIQAPVSTATGMAVGIAPRSVQASYYFWLQTWGPANALVKTAVTTVGGATLIRDVAAAGSVCPQVAGAGCLYK